MSSMEITSNRSYYTLPIFNGPYIDPRVSKGERDEIEKKRLELLDEALNFLATFDTHAIQKKRKVCCMPCCDNTVLNLATYIITRPWAMFSRAYCCCFKSCGKSRKVKPIPENALQMLEVTQEQFDRNTCGLLFLTPAVIAASALLPVFITVSKCATAGLSIASNLVITTTAGTSTYVFSGDIGVVPDERGGLIVQGGIRVDTITKIKKAYEQLSLRLNGKWANANKQEKRIIGAQCKEIRERWDFILDAIVSIGIQESAAKDILAPFSHSIYCVLDDFGKHEGDLQKISKNELVEVKGKANTIEV